MKTIVVTGCGNCLFIGHGAADNHMHKHCAYPFAVEGVQLPKGSEVTDAHYGGGTPALCQLSHVLIERGGQ